MSEPASVARTTHRSHPPNDDPPNPTIDLNIARAIVARHQPHPEIRSALYCADCTWPWPCPIHLAYHAGLADGATNPAGGTNAD